MIYIQLFLYDLLPDGSLIRKSTVCNEVTVSKQIIMIMGYHYN